MIKTGIRFRQNLFTAPDRQFVFPALGEQVELSKTFFQIMAKGCLIFVPIVAPRNKMEPHPLLMGQGQGGVVLPTVGQLLPPNHTMQP